MIVIEIILGLMALTLCMAGLGLVVYCVTMPGPDDNKTDKKRRSTRCK